MALTTEMTSVLELLMNELLARRQSFLAIFKRMKPIMQYETEFLVGFFLGYAAHCCKELFLILRNREMQDEEIDEVLEFLMRNDSKIREAFFGKRVPNGVIERSREAEDKIKLVQIATEKVNTLELTLDEIRNEINLIKEIAKEKIKRHEVQLAKNGRFEESILR